MVLQDLGDSPSDSFGDGPSQDDSADAYSSPANRIDTSQFARSLPIPLMGFSESSVRRRTEATIKYAERRIHRAMTLEEQQVLASYLWKLEQTKSYFTALGVVAGGWRAYKTMGINRYPFYRPNPENMNPNKFMFVRGPAAFYARHSWRFLLYFAFGGQVGKFIGQAFAQPAAAQNTSNDPRLAQFGKDLKTALGVEHPGVRQGGGNVEGERARLESYERMRRERAERAERWGERLGLKIQKSSQTSSTRAESSTTPGSSMDDDMSPTAGNDQWSGTSSTSWGDLGLSDVKETSAAPQQQQRAPRPDRDWKIPASRTDDDNMSPTGGLFQDDVQNQQRTGQSAWDRLRRGQGPSPGQRPPSRKPEPPHKDQREESTLGDSFTFADSDDGRRKAQERAQREFDARIERERQGRDFTDEKKW